MTSDIAIAQSAKMLRISQVAQRYDIEEEYLEPYGHYKAKISLDFLDTLKDKPDGKPEEARIYERRCMGSL